MIRRCLLAACALLLAACGDAPKGFIADFALERHLGPEARASIRSKSGPAVDAVGLYIRSAVAADIAGVPKERASEFVDRVIESIRAELESRGFVPEVVHTERNIWFVKYDLEGFGGTVMLRARNTDEQPWTLTAKLLETP